MFEQEYAPRWRKAAKIVHILRDHLSEAGLNKARTLDLGCADGAITQTISPHVHSIVGLDLDAAALQQARTAANSAAYIFGNGARLPFAGQSFDLVICAQVYEHAGDQQELAAEIWRVLRPGGVCFFSGPNRLAIIEEHYWLPFLSWLPQRLADAYLKATGRGRYYDVKPLLYWQLRRLWRPFQIIDYTPRLFKQPERFGVDDELGRLIWVRQLPLQLWKIMGPFLPNFNWILVK